MGLLSTKSFSLDVPGSEKSDESDRLISGASSPGHRNVKAGRDISGQDQVVGSLQNSLSPISPSKSGRQNEHKEAHF